MGENSSMGLGQAVRGSSMRPLALALVVLAATTPARAVPITGLVRGTIATNMSEPIRVGMTAYQFTVGESFSLSYTFDSDRAMLVGTPGATEARYEIRPAFFSLTTGGGYEATGASTGGTFEPARVMVTNGTTDALRLSIGDADGYINLSLSDPTGTALDSLALPSIADLGRFPVASFDFSKERQFGFEGFRATGAPVAVPEPSGLATVGVGTLLSLGYARRRKRAAAWDGVTLGGGAGGSRDHGFTPRRI